MGKCINCNTLVVKMKTEMQEILMDHVKIISRIQKFVSTTEANEEAALRDLPDEMQTRQEKDYDTNEQDEVINVENEEEEEIYECEKCNEIFETLNGLGNHLEMHYQKKHLSNDFAIVKHENNASNGNEQEEQQVSNDENTLESDEIEEAADEQVINDDNFYSDQSEIDEPEVQAIDNVELPMNEEAIKIEQQEVDAIQRLMCQKTFANEQEFRDHLENSYESESVSEESDDSFENVETYVNGQTSESNVDENVEENLQCEICDTLFGDLKQLLNHFDTHHDNLAINFVAGNPNRKHHCNDLSSINVTESDIVQCHICEKNLQQHTLPKHMQQVHAKTQFVCEICYKTFFSKDYVNKHKMFVHES